MEGEGVFWSDLKTDYESLVCSRNEEIVEEIVLATQIGPTLEQGNDLKEPVVVIRHMDKKISEG